MVRILRALAVLATMISLSSCVVIRVPQRILFGPTPDAVATQQAIVQSTQAAQRAGPPAARPSATRPPTATAPATPTVTHSPAATRTPTATASPTATATPLPTPTVCRYDAGQVAVTAPAIPPLVPGARFVQEWRLRNTGNCAWAGTFTLAHVDGWRLGADEAVRVGALAPGAETTVSVPMQAPESAGEYTSGWRMRDAAGNYFGATLTASIVVTTTEPLAAATVVSRP